jgi:hypothetical protein
VQPRWGQSAIPQGLQAWQRCTALLRDNWKAGDIATLTPPGNEEEGRVSGPLGFS